MAEKDLSDLKPVYLIFGTEEYLLDKAVTGSHPGSPRSPTWTTT